MAKKGEVEKLLSQHEQLVHSENMRVISHVQRQDNDWLINILMIEGYDVPFKYRRKKRYKDLRGARVNLTYYPITELVAGVEFEVMKVVRLKLV